MTPFSATSLANVIETALSDTTGALLLPSQLDMELTEDMIDAASDLLDEDTIVIPFFNNSTVAWIAVGTDAVSAWSMWSVAMRELLNQAPPHRHKDLLEMSEAVRRLVSEGENTPLEPITAPVRH